MEVIKIFNQTESSFARYANSVRKYKEFVLDWGKASWPYLAAFFCSAALHHRLIGTGRPHLYDER